MAGPPTTTLPAVREMGNLDYFFLAPELDAALNGGWLNQTYDVKDGFRMKFRKGGELNLLVEFGVRAHLATTLPPAPFEQTSFTKLLRQSLANARVESVKQVGFDRILRVNFSTIKPVKALVFEQFGEGNVLALGENDSIIRPLRGKEYAHRALHKGIGYTAPPSPKIHPHECTAQALCEGVLKGGQGLVARVCSKVDLPPFYAEEACARCSLAPTAVAAGIEKHEWEALAREIQMMPSIAKEPVVYYTEGENGPVPYAFAPFELRKLEGVEGLEPKHFTGFSDCLEAYYLPSWVGALQKESQVATDSKEGKLRHTLGEQESAIARFENDIRESMSAGEWIMGSNLMAVQAVIDEAVALRKQGLDAGKISEALTTRFGKALGGVKFEVDPSRLKLGIIRAQQP